MHQILTGRNPRKHPPSLPVTNVHSLTNISVFDYYVQIGGTLNEETIDIKFVKLVTSFLIFQTCLHWIYGCNIDNRGGYCNIDSIVKKENGKYCFFLLFLFVDFECIFYFNTIVPRASAHSHLTTYTPLFPRLIIDPGID